MQILVPHNLKLTDRASSVLDAIRGVAAFFVMISHVRNLFFVDYEQVTHRNILIRTLYFLTSLGHQAVIVFFVLSGFFISLSVLRMHQQNRWSWREYLLQRLCRLWIVLIPALLLTALWDGAGIHFFGRGSVYAGLAQDSSVLHFSTVARLNLPTFFSNLFFLQGILTPTFGSNGPLWSLSYEFWYYMAYPCLLLALVSRSREKKIGYLCLVLVLGIMVGKEIALSFAIWLLGAAIVYFPGIWTGERRTKAVAIVLGVLPFAGALLYSVAKKGSLATDSVALPFLLIIVLALKLPELTADSLVPRRWPKIIANFSYSLYLLHLPPLVLLHAYLHSTTPSKWQPAGPAFLASLVIAICVTTYCWLVSLQTEARTAQLRSVVRRLLIKPLPQRALG